MALSEKLNDTKKRFDQAMRKRKFKKANLEREAKAELLVEIAQCSGSLNTCLVSFKDSITEQVRNIKIGQEGGYDTLPQEQILWDSAIGYMLVKDAIFALKSVTSFNSLSNAYDLLNKAIKQVSGRKNKTLKYSLNGEAGRDAYGYLNSEDIIKRKSEILDGFFEELKKTGDIEGCLTKARDTQAVDGSRRNSYSTGSGGGVTSKVGEFDSFFDDVKEEDFDFDVNALAEQAMTDIKPPVKDSEGL